MTFNKVIELNMNSTDHITCKPDKKGCKTFGCM